MPLGLAQNSPELSLLAYYRRNVYYTFIDHCIKEFIERFPESSLSRVDGYILHPGKLSKINSKEVEAIKKFYGSDLPSPATFEAEVKLWKENFSSYDVTQFDKMKLRCLKDWSRSTLTEERMNGLVLMYIHQDKVIDKVNVLKRFDCSGLHRIKL